MQDVFVHPAGQDDNLGDSALRDGLLRALRGNGARLHVHLEGQTSDYLPGVPLRSDEAFYPERRAWLAASDMAAHPVYVVNAGEINPQPEMPFPHARRAGEMRRVTNRGGIVIAAGLGLKNPAIASRVVFDSALRDAAVMSWRDAESQAAAGFGGVAPDWAFALGSDPSIWATAEDRPLIAITLRFDRPWPTDDWIAELRGLAVRTDRRIVTVAQVARDAPRAVLLAERLGGEYLVAASTRHDDLDKHVRAVYARSLVVVSDRAHALIMGATEGAYPLGTAADPQKIQRLLDAAGVGALTGHHDGLASRASQLEAVLPDLQRAVRQARRDLRGLTERIHAAMDAAAG
ncbi:polysaccharide pyruvyl transferase family protein [Microbacterium hominis]|uniref:polysaccharide pyruvyl transferase family protein n=1 Tax=Microbacterium hominis TaxID=162426 RepID=UPI0020B662BD|nr:polysaccharide pyruvyl transferase family protein [Microbacterium hominis]